MLEWMFVLATGALTVRAAWLALGGRARAARGPAALAATVFGVACVVFRNDLAMQKLLSYLVMPSGLLWLALSGLVLALARRERALFAWGAAVWLAYTLLGSTWVSSLMLSPLERGVPTTKIAALPELDAVLVLGGGAGFDDRGEAALTDFGDRVYLGARIYHAGKTKLLVTSGSTIPGLHRARDLSEATQILWRDVGIPDSAILRLPQPKNTSQEIAAFAALARERGFQKVGLLTSAWHLARAMARCRDAGLEVTPLAADRRSGEPVFHPTFMVPSPGGFRVSQLALWEMLGALVGR